MFCWMIQFEKTIFTYLENLINHLKNQSKMCMFRDGVEIDVWLDFGFIKIVVKV